MRPRLLAFGAPLATALTAVHLAPAVTSMQGARMRWWPSLAGLGDRGHVALTFDDGPDPTSTPEFLKMLDRLGWRATFFFLGEMVRAWPGLAAEVAARGHEVAVHGDRHRSLLTRSGPSIRRDLSEAVTAIADATGRCPTWFRPPYGVLSTGAMRAAKSLRLQPVLWTCWGRDWRSAATPQSVVTDVLAGLTPGATVLLHDSDCTSDRGSWRATLGALPYLAEELANRQLAVGPLAEHGIVPSSSSGPALLSRSPALLSSCEIPEVD